MTKKVYEGRMIELHGHVKGEMFGLSLDLGSCPKCKSKRRLRLDVEDELNIEFASALKEQAKVKVTIEVLDD